MKYVLLCKKYKSQVLKSVYQVSSWGNLDVFKAFKKHSQPPVSVRSLSQAMVMVQTVCKYANVSAAAKSYRSLQSSDGEIALFTRASSSRPSLQSVPA